MRINDEMLDPYDTKDAERIKILGYFNRFAFGTPNEIAEYTGIDTKKVSMYLKYGPEFVYRNNDPIAKDKYAVRGIYKLIDEDDNDMDSRIANWLKSWNDFGDVTPLNGDY